MKVAIGPLFSSYGGMSRHILGIKKYSSHSIHLIPSPTSRIPFWITNKLSNKLFRIELIDYYQKVISRLMLGRYDVVHSHAAPWIIEVARTLRNSRCKWVHTYHMIYFAEDFPKGLDDSQLETNAHLINVASQADIRLSVSKWLQKYLLETHSIETRYVPNGYDHRVCEMASAGRFVRRYGHSDFILYNGSSEPRKNPDMFITLAGQLKDQRMLMIGRGLGIDALREKYGAKITGNIVALGELPYKDVLDAVAACKVYVMTSKREGLPTALLEAMGMGKSVVASRVPGCEEVIENNVTGFLYEPDSLDYLVEKTSKALNSKNTSKKAKQVARETYSWEVVAKSIDKIYSEG